MVNVCISDGSAQMNTVWHVSHRDGITVINPTDTTAAALGLLVSLAPRTFVGPIHRKLAAAELVEFPIDLACWWQGTE